MIIRVIRGRQRQKNLQDLRNLREKEIRDNPCHPWEVKIRNLCSVKNKEKKYCRNIEIIRNFAEESSEKCINIAQNRTL